MTAPETPSNDDFADRAQAIKEAIAREETVIAPPPAPAAADATPEEAGASADDAGQATGESPAEESVEGSKERVVVGEDDLLADVDSGVNEDEFKW